MLYAMLLDRLSLSTRNGWQDEDGQVFVYFKMSEAEEQLDCELDCGHSKMIRLSAELESSGLIRRKRQGQGKPMKIYVQNLLEAEQTSENDAAELSGKDTFESENEPMQTSDQLENSPPGVLFSDDRLAEDEHWH